MLNRSHESCRAPDPWNACCHERQTHGGTAAAQFVTSDRIPLPGAMLPVALKLQNAANHATDPVATCLLRASPDLHRTAIRARHPQPEATPPVFACTNQRPRSPTQCHVEYSDNDQRCLVGGAATRARDARRYSDACLLRLRDTPEVGEGATRVACFESLPVLLELPAASPGATTRTDPSRPAVGRKRTCPALATSLAES